MRVAFPLVALLQACSVHSEKKPNVLVVLADDLGTGDIEGYYEDTCKVTEMKNVQNLMSKGIVFTDAHATPLCAPSRYSFLSGNYQIRGQGAKYRKSAGVHWGIGKGPQFKRGQMSIADVFKDNGYNTAMVGKWHTGGKIMPNGKKSKEHILTHPEHDWSIPFEGGPQDIGFKSSYITTAGIQKPPYAFFRDGLLETNVSEVVTWEKGEHDMPHGNSKIIASGEGDPNWDTSAYHMILVNETIRFLDDHLENTPDDPFFAYFATGGVHIPHSPPKNYIDGTPIAGTQHTPHMDMLLELDLVVGDLVKALEDRDLVEDTIIVFTSDNGGLSGKGGDSFDSKGSGGSKFGHLPNGGLKGSKGSLWEGGHRIPMILRYDRLLPYGETRDHLVGINDLFSTLSEMANLAIPNGQAQDSISFAKYAQDKTNDQNLRDHFKVWKTDSGCALRTMDYKLIYTYNKETNKWLSQLYSMKNDPMETTDLSQLPSYMTLRKEMLETLLFDAWCCAGKKCVY